MKIKCSEGYGKIRRSVLTYVLKCLGVSFDGAAGVSDEYLGCWHADPAGFMRIDSGAPDGMSNDA